MQVDGGVDEEGQPVTLDQIRTLAECSEKCGHIFSFTFLRKAPKEGK